MASNIYLSVIVPSYNEIVNLQKGVLDKIDHFLSKQKYSYEVIIVDDGSTDGSELFAEQFVKENNNFRLIKSSHSGKAGAVSKGMLEAIGEVRLFTDMDQATPIEEVNRLIPFIKDYDIVIGSRNTQRKGSPFSRIIMSRSQILLRKFLVGLYDIQDTQCGFKLFNKEPAIKLFDQVNSLHNGYKKISGSNVSSGFDVELLYLAQKRDYKIREVPVVWLYVETRRVSPIMDSINGVKDLLIISKNKFSGTYKV